MRPIRLMLACLLSLGVAIQGYAGTRAMEADCPMMHPAAAHQMHMPAAGMHDMADMPEEPCHADETAPSTGSTGHCACVIGCQPASSMSLLVPMAAALPLLRQALPQPAPAFQSHTAFRHWRPPALA